MHKPRYCLARHEPRARHAEDLMICSQPAGESSEASDGKSAARHSYLTRCELLSDFNMTAPRESLQHFAAPADAERMATKDCPSNLSNRC